MVAIGVRGLAAFPANRGHVLAVSAHGLAASAPCFSGFFGGELVSASPLVGRPSAFAGYFALLCGIHSRESSIAAPIPGNTANHCCAFLSASVKRIRNNKMIGTRRNA